MPERDPLPEARDWSAEVRRRLPSVPGRDRATVVEEVAQHLAARHDEALAGGASAEGARAAALRELDGWREPPPAPPPAGRGAPSWTTFGAELRLAARSLRRQPGLALAVVLLLGLGIGTATTLFSVVHAVLLRPYPFADPERLVLVWESAPQLGFDKLPFSPADLEDVRREQRSFTGLGAISTRRFELSGPGGEPARVNAARTAAALFDVLGVAPALGRTYTDEEDRRGERLVVLSHGLWRRRFGGDGAVLGARVALDRVPYTVVGVMPASFRFPLPGPAYNAEPAELWVPASFTPEEREARASFFNFTVVGRLAPGVALAAAREELRALAPRVQANYPAPVLRALGNVRLDLLAFALRDELAGPSRGLLGLLLAAGGALLVVACANVANLLLSRTAARRKELAVRAALGAGRWRLLRLLVAESLVLALAGGALGSLLARAGIAALPALLPAELPLAEPLRLDAGAAAVALGLALVSALGIGAAPGLLGLRTDLQAALHDGRATATPARRRVQGGFAVAQIALALVLLVGAGLLVRSLARLLGTDPGFRPGPVLALSTALPAAAYPTADDVRGFYERLVERLGALPSVDAAGASTDLPLQTREVRAIQVEGQDLRGEQLPAVAHSWTAGRYLDTLGVPLLAGRRLDARDGRDAPHVVVVSASLARRLWPGADPLGKRLRTSSVVPWMTVVGVVGDVKDGPLHSQPRPHSYSPLAQEADEFFTGDVTSPLRALNVVLRTRLDPADLAGSVRRELRALDPELALVKVRPLGDDVRASVAPQRTAATLLALFAGAAVLLAAVGLYGVLAYRVARRTREIGVRLALGARGADVARLVARSGAGLLALGLALGLPGAWAAARLMRSLLFGLAPHDPPTFVATAALVAAVALVACYVPARRAARVDPLVALRAE